MTDSRPVPRAVPPPAPATAQSGTVRGRDRRKASLAAAGIAPCLFYLFVEFGRPMDWFTPLALVKPGLIAAGWAFLATTSRARRGIRAPLGVMFGFLVLMTWHVPWATNNAWALWGLWDFTILVLGGALPIVLLTPDLHAAERLMRFFFVLHLPAAIHGFLYGGRGPGPWMGDENDLALALNVAVGVGIYLLLATKTTGRRLAIFAGIALMIAGVVVTGSRGGFVGLAALGVYLLMVGPHRGMIVSCLLIAVLALALLAPAQYWEEVSTISNATEKGDTGETRLYYWGIGWRMFLDHPIAGVGTGNFGIRAPEYQDPSRKGWAVHTWGRVAHSLYFTLLPEHGLIGAFLFCGMLLFFLRAQLRMRQAARRSGSESARRQALLATGLGAGMFGVLVTGIFLSVFYYPVLWILASMMGALDAVVSEEATGDEPRPASAGSR